MSHIGNTKDVSACVSTGNIGSNNTFEVKGTGGITSLGNTTGIKVTGLNTGGIGSGSTYQVKAGELAAGASLGDTTNVNAVNNQGNIGSGNRYTTN